MTEELNAAHERDVCYWMISRRAVLVVLGSCDPNPGAGATPRTRSRAQANSAAFHRPFATVCRHFIGSQCVTIVMEHSKVPGALKHTWRWWIRGEPEIAVALLGCGIAGGRRHIDCDGLVRR